MEIPVAAGAVATAVFASSTLPMLAKAWRTRAAAIADPVTPDPRSARGGVRPSGRDRVPAGTP